MNYFDVPSAILSTIHMIRFLTRFSDIFYFVFFLQFFLRFELSVNYYKLFPHIKFVLGVFQYFLQKNCHLKNVKIIQV